MRFPQKATYWDIGTRNGFGGLDYPEPEVINVRWEDKPSLFISASGEEIQAKAVVYSEKELNVEGYLYLGELDESLEAAERMNPLPLTDAFKIMAFSVIPNIRASRHEYKAWLGMTKTEAGKD